MDSESGAAGREKAIHSIPAEEERSTLLQLSSGRLLIAALSSPNLSLALAFVGGIVSFADDLLPDRMYQSLFQSAGKLLPGSWISIAALALIVSWLLSAVLYTIKYAGFTVERFGKQISVSCGLLREKTALLPGTRIGHNRKGRRIPAMVRLRRSEGSCAYVRVREAFHAASSAEDRGYSGTAEAGYASIQRSGHFGFAAAPRQMDVRPLEAGFAAAVSAACIWYFDRLGLLSLLLLPLSFAWGLLSHRDSGLNVTGKQLTIRSRFIAMSTRYIRRPQIIAMEVSGTRRQRRKGLLSFK